MKYLVSGWFFLLRIDHQTQFSSNNKFFRKMFIVLTIFVALIFFWPKKIYENSEKIGNSYFLHGNFGIVQFTKMSFTNLL